MKTYRVEEMAGEMAVSRHVANADTPWEAATNATGKEVKGRREEKFWVRVTDEQARAVYKYVFKWPFVSRLQR
ncbi:hypothetical protein SAMN03159463_00812 [Mesorhizobium sp. NFR06]|jgi:hypothetical protein|uniref:hypothetical protein n=1 Tax=Mesorhizobium sp. NFR06 TaxID=1566290 RepID=UPI0008EFA9C6|nr:hypothetical protein [Mesorhizobium sp. NFR06]SFN99866.1 hypothetical protein SAMN03159463_00812 [Mesorhizobium sp. NFR06]